MNSTASIAQNVTLDVDLASICSDASGQKSVHFNVSKLYKGQDNFVFESTLEIRCKNAYYLNVKQTGHAQFDLRNSPLTVEDIHSIVTGLFDDTLASWQDFRERDNSSVQNKSVSAISVPANLLEQYLSSPNYFDLLKCCVATPAE